MNNVAVFYLAVLLTARKFGVLSDFEMRSNLILSSTIPDICCELDNRCQFYISPCIVLSQAMILSVKSLTEFLNFFSSLELVCNNFFPLSKIK